MLSTIARISQRAGYRAPDRVLAAIRPTLSYDRLDELTKALLDLVAEGGDGHDAFMGLLEADRARAGRAGRGQGRPDHAQLALDLLLRPSDNELFVTAEGARR